MPQLTDFLPTTRKEMEMAAKSLDFLAAARHRDKMHELEKLRDSNKKSTYPPINAPK